jgi:23S rRNA-/tRNA-specific pseudouridylate synthase
LLNQQFEGRTVRKLYLALAHGRIPQDSGFIDKPLRAFGSGRMGVDAARGKESATAYSVLERLAACTLVEARPFTGRRHQLRVHLYSIGHPLVGDGRYGDLQAQSRFPRLMLHARRLECCLPSGEEWAVEAPVPRSFAAVLDQCRSCPCP